MIDVHIMLNVKDADVHPMLHKRKKTNGILNIKDIDVLILKFKRKNVSISDNSDGNMYEHNNGDSNMTRGKVLCTFDFRYNNIKDREMNNGNEERDKNNDR